MRRYLILTTLAGIIIGSWATRPAPVRALIGLEGRILRSPAGSLWYASPRNHLRYYLGRTTADAWPALLATALGISNANIEKIPFYGSSVTGDLALRNRLAGYILLQVEDHGRLWWVTPVSRQRIELVPDAGLWSRLWGYSGAVSTESILAFTAATGFTGPPPRPINGLAHAATTITNSRGTFTVDLITLDLTATTSKIMTDTGQTTDCTTGCITMSLGTYVGRRSGVAGMHGTYFCPLDYASCAGQTNSYLYPVYNSFSRVMINNRRIKYTTQPMVAFDTTNTPHYFAQAIDFVNQASFESRFGVTLRAAISNGPAMIAAGRNILAVNQLDSKQATVKSYRGGLGWKGTKMFFFIVRGATVTDSASVAQSLGLDYAINLDGGGSTAMVLNGKYLIGPGRNLPNAIVIVP